MKLSQLPKYCWDHLTFRLPFHESYGVSDTQKAGTARSEENSTATERKKMSAADFFKLLAAVLTGISCIVGLLAWHFSVQEAKKSKAEARKKESELERYKIEANERISANEAVAATANERTATLNERTAALESTNLALRAEVEQAKLETEKLRRENLELETSLSPRVFMDQNAAGERLKAYAPVKVLIQCLNDRECIRTAEQIFATLRDFAKWQVTVEITPPEAEWDFFDAVTVHGTAREGILGGGQRLSDAADELVDELNKTKIKAFRHGHPVSKDADFVVRIGLKPNPVMERLSSQHGVQNDPDFQRMEKMKEQFDEQRRIERADRKKRKDWSP